MARPGIMVYFEILEAIRELPDRDKGKLFVAMMEYGKNGVPPKLKGTLSAVWPFVRQMIDKDENRYEDMKLQREYAAFCKKRKRIWMPKIPFDDWIAMTDDERQRAVDPVVSRNPTTSTSTSSASATANSYNEQLQLQQSTTTTKAEGAAAAAGVRDGVKPFGGELGKGVVFLTEEQEVDLLSRLGLDAFNRYMGKLSEFILRNGDKFISHYDTILKWWKEDSSPPGCRGG